MHKSRHVIKAGLLGLALLGTAFASAPGFAQTKVEVRTNDKVRANDWAWMEKVARAGAAEVQAGKLAATKASNPEVRALAEQMAADHAKANEELKSIASSKGITLPEEPDRAHKREYAKLEKLTAGSRFDEEYLARPGVIDHKDAVALFKKGSKDLQDADIKAFADKTLPTIQHHYEMAQKLNK